MVSRRRGAGIPRGRLRRQPVASTSGRTRRQANPGLSRPSAAVATSRARGRVEAERRSDIAAPGGDHAVGPAGAGPGPKPGATAGRPPVKLPRRRTRDREEQLPFTSSPSIRRSTCLEPSREDSSCRPPVRAGRRQRSGVEASVPPVSQSPTGNLTYIPFGLVPVRCFPVLDANPPIDSGCPQSAPAAGDSVPVGEPAREIAARDAARPDASAAGRRRAGACALATMASRFADTLQNAWHRPRRSLRRGDEVAAAREGRRKEEGLALELPNRVHPVVSRRPAAGAGSGGRRCAHAGTAASGGRRIIGVIIRRAGQSHQSVQDLVEHMPARPGRHAGVRPRDISAR